MQSLDARVKIEQRKEDLEERMRRAASISSAFPCPPELKARRREFDQANLEAVRRIAADMFGRASLDVSEIGVVWTGHGMK